MEVYEMTFIKTKTFVLALVMALASTTVVVASQHMKSEGANAITGTISLVDAQSGIIWLKDKNDERIKLVAPPEEQLKGLEVGNRVEVRLKEQTGAKTSETQADQTVAGKIRKVDEASQLLRIETTQGNIIDISPPKDLLAGMEEGEQVTLSIYEKSSQ
jgi:hypothetical protein